MRTDCTWVQNQCMETYLPLLQVRSIIIGQAAWSQTTEKYVYCLGYLHCTSRHGFTKINTTVPKWLKQNYRQEFYEMDVLASRTGKRNQSTSIWCVLEGLIKSLTGVVMVTQWLHNFALLSFGLATLGKLELLRLGVCCSQFLSVCVSNISTYTCMWLAEQKPLRILWKLR